MNKDLLYHYTSADAFVGMINGGKAIASKCGSKDIEKSLLFWASSVYTMNDPSEMFYGYDKVTEMIKRADDKKILTSYYDQIVISDYTEGQKAKFFMDHFFNVEKTPFVISFSLSKETETEKDNDEELFMLSMYGDSGRGVRLGFDIDLVSTKENGDKSEVLIFPICYDDEKIEDILYPILLQQVKDSYKRLETIKDAEGIVWEKVVSIASIYMMFCSLIKDPNYRKENEWRVITHSHNASLTDVKIRTRGTLIVPYVELFIPIRYLREIIVGPCCDFDLQKRSIELTLKSFGIDINTIRIEKSRIPYRNM
ncbi:MAG: DUF2971 domain-containing protein [Prevotella sp.]|nr:DUF2971 domain-containing protein [Prevotella sp.]